MTKIHTKWHPGPFKNGGFSAKFHSSCVEIPPPEASLGAQPTEVVPMSGTEPRFAPELAGISIVGSAAELAVC